MWELGVDRQYMGDRQAQILRKCFLVPDSWGQTCNLLIPGEML